MPDGFRIGVDENGLGARLGPLVVTAVLARVSEAGARTLARRPPKKLAALLDDSKALMSHHDWAVGEAWARVLGPERAADPDALFAGLSLDPAPALRARCPTRGVEQCWAALDERFVADPELVERAREARDELAARGVELLEVKTRVLCTERLNDGRERGLNRFVLDLHAMEALVLALRKQAGADVTAVCGKVGGMGDYPRFFGPLGGWLHVVLEQKKKQSAYRIPGLGELRFVQDADGRDALVMLASLVGKWVRELLMARVARFYQASLDASDPISPSGYNDPVTARFVEATALVRRKQKIPLTCFERRQRADD